jgi:NAD(P)-dependent dehydrogenase (short-subunit alcohol dehydrogenase family)
MTQTTVIVGASRGIGLELVRQAAARGDRVIATVRREGDKAKPLEAGADLVLVADVMEPASLNAIASMVDEPVDLLVCNAGVLNSYGGVEAAAHDRWAWLTVLMTNVAGPFFSARAFLPQLERGGAGKVAILSSSMGSNELAKGNAYPYRASKAGATNLARNLAVELAERGISVGAYHPGWVRTDMGGGEADVPVEEAAAGLLARFDALGPDTSGVVEDYKGTPIPF